MLPDGKHDDDEKRKEAEHFITTEINIWQLLRTAIRAAQTECMYSNGMLQCVEC